MTRRGVRGYAVKTKAESVKRRLAKLAKRAREKKARGLRLAYLTVDLTRRSVATQGLR
jgi:hypothetical protein